jgi:hypothetical protein
MKLNMKGKQMIVEVVVTYSKLTRDDELSSSKIRRFLGDVVLYPEHPIGAQVATWLDAMHQLEYKLHFSRNALEFKGYIVGVEHTNDKSVLQVSIREISGSYTSTETLRVGTIEVDPFDRITLELLEAPSGGEEC